MLCGFYHLVALLLENLQKLSPVGSFGTKGNKVGVSGGLSLGLSAGVSGVCVSLVSGIVANLGNPKVGTVDHAL